MPDKSVGPTLQTLPCFRDYISASYRSQALLRCWWYRPHQFRTWHKFELGGGAKEILALMFELDHPYPLAN